MAKKLPCTGCGELRWPTRTSDGCAAPRCRACRNASPTHGLPSTYSRHKCRCDPCREAWNEQTRKYLPASRARRLVRAERDCIVCSTTFNPRANQVTCSTECRKVHLGRLGGNASRAAHFGVPYEIVDRHEVFDSDGWVCGICALPIDQSLTFPNPGSVTLDHIIPMSRGGGHVRANVQAAHFYCNTVKGSKEAAC